MDGEAVTVSGCSLRENKRSYKDLLIDEEDLEEAESDVEEQITKRPHKISCFKCGGFVYEPFQEPKGSPNKKVKHTDDTSTWHELHGAESSGFVPAYPVCVSQHGWTMKGEEENIQDNLLHPGCTAEGSTAQRTPRPMLEYMVYLDNQNNMADRRMNNRTLSTSVPPVRDGSYLSVPVPSSVTAIATTVSSRVSSFMTDTCGPTGSLCGVISSAWNTFSSTSRSLHHSEQDPVSAAAHLHLLGESLSLIGLHLQETNKMVCMSSGFSLLLDSLLCALAPLICLTTQIPELKSCTRHTLGSTLENIAYVMPGL